MRLVGAVVCDVDVADVEGRVGALDGATVEGGDGGIRFRHGAEAHKAVGLALAAGDNGAEADRAKGAEEAGKGRLGGAGREALDVLRLRVRHHGHVVLVAIHALCSRAGAM